MRFQGNRYDGEEQVREVLKEKMKFTEDVSGETFRKKCEQRLFTQQSMPWNEIKRRAATNPAWQWHLPSALDDLKADCLFRDAWREQGGFVDKGPFPQPKTSVTFREVQRNDETGEVLLRLTPIHGDTLYWEIGSQATTASAKMEGNELSTRELRLSFLCVDSTGQHETGDVVAWQNRITLKYRTYQRGADKMMELQAAPLADIRYTSDGSDPKLSGARYLGDFVIPRGAPLVQAYAERDGIASDVLRAPIDWEQNEDVKVDPHLPANFTRAHKTASTQETYTWLETLGKFNGQVVGLTLTIGGDASAREWLELAAAEAKKISPEQIKDALETLRRIQAAGQVVLQTTTLYFANGQDFLDWVAENRLELNPGEVTQ